MAQPSESLPSSTRGVNRPVLPGRRWPSVSVVVVNLDGREYLDRCLGSLRALDYPPGGAGGHRPPDLPGGAGGHRPPGLPGGAGGHRPPDLPEQVEVILVDNASTDGSVEHVRATYPEVRVVVNDTNTGFSPAVNQGARLATGRYLALINNDAEADPAWLREAVKVLEGDKRAACVASKILREDRKTIDYAGGQMSFYGHGFNKGVEQTDVGGDRMRRTLFASGGALVARLGAFLDVGGFDESYFAFFEDVDFGWRLWVLGHEVVYVPTSRVYHRHHGTIQRFGYARERYLLERNALATIFKNYEDDRLARILPASIILTLARGMDVEGAELPDYRITPGAEPLEELKLPAVTGAHLAALRDFALMLDDLRVKRELIQSQRRGHDRTVMKLFETAMRPNIDRPDFLEAFQQTVRAFDLNDHARPRSSVLILTQDFIGARMAGPAIRCWEMAKVLAHEHEVTLGSTQKPDLEHEAFTTLQVDDSNIGDLLLHTEVVVFQGFIMEQFPQIAASDKPVLVDVYDPFHLEGLNLRKEEPEPERYATARSDARVLNEQFRRADFLVCASEKQRDFWLGQLTSVGRINPATFDEDESLRNLIDVAPFGLPDEPPQKREDVVKGVIDGVAKDDFLLLWGGGIYNWFDPLTLVKAVGRVAEDHPDVKLFFMGSAHPNPAVPKMRMAGEAYRLAEAIGLLGSHVFFNEGWVPYEQRADYLLEADVGVSTHFEHVETAFSYRTRILDYLWAGLPIVATEGDSLARLIREHDLGLVVPAEDVDALAEAIARLRTDSELFETCRAHIAELAPQMTWYRTLEPVMEFCRRPHHAADRVGRRQRYVAGKGVTFTRSPLHYARRFWDYYRASGPQIAMIHARNFLRSRLGG